MSIGNNIRRLRNTAGISQEKFAAILGVTRQAVQKWENDICVPETDKAVKIAKYFGITLDSLILDSSSRTVEEIVSSNKNVKPDFDNIESWAPYTNDIMIELEQSLDEGLDLEKYRELFSAVSMLPKSEIRHKFCDLLYETVANAQQIPDYKYTEPSDLESIKSLRKPYTFKSTKSDISALEKKIHGAWIGRVCGCLLGKPIEGIRTDELIPLLKETENYPMHRYVLSSDITEEMCEKYSFRLRNKAYADTVNGMPVDDDTNYVVLAQKIISDYGRDFTPLDVSKAWRKYQSIDSYFTAERVAFQNYINGFEPPKSASFKNPYREWIGAQIRGDYFGYINPGNPELAAEMAFKDACISHIKNGIYGEMFVSAMLACAAVTNDIKDIVLGGLAQIPCTSRLFEAVLKVVGDFENGVSKKECFGKIHTLFDEHKSHGWCHTISNAMIVTASLLYGGGDFGKSICIAVETGFDTDCNGATVGSILGMRNAINSIEDVWTKPINDIIHTSILGAETVKISECVQETMRHILIDKELIK